MFRSKISEDINQNHTIFSIGEQKFDHDLAKVHSFSNSRFFPTVNQSRSCTNHTPDEINARLRTTPQHSWFFFNEEIPNWTVGETRSDARSVSLGRYAPDFTHSLSSEQNSILNKHASSSFCKEPDRLLTTICLREKRQENRPGSRNLLSESQRWWSV